MTHKSSPTGPGCPFAWYCLLILTLFPGTASRAMEWRPDTSFKAEIEYTDNLYMVGNHPTADTFLFGNADFRLNGESDTRHIRLDAGVQMQRLQKTRQANNEFYSAGMAFSQTFMKGQFDFQARYGEDSTRGTDLETIGVTPNFIFGKRRTVTIVPRLEMSANENNRLALAAGYDRIRYDLPDYTDYTNTHFQFDWYHTPSEQIELDTQILAQRYDSLDNLVDHDYGSILEIVDIDASERWHYQVGAGLGYLVRNVGENYRTFLGRFSATRESDNSQFVIRTESSLQPTSAAQLSRLSQFQLVYRWFASDTDTLDAEMRLSRSNIIDVSPSYTNDLLRANLGYTSQISERLVWNIRYAFIINRTSRDTLDRVTNSIFASLTLTFDE